MTAPGPPIETPGLPTETLAALQGGGAARELRERVRNIENASHELVEIRLLSQLRAGVSGLGEEAAEARRVLGNDGHDAAIRLGLAPTSSPAEIHDAAIAMIGRWRMLAEDPVMVHDARDVARGVIRTCEELAVPSA